MRRFVIGWLMDDVLNDLDAFTHQIIKRDNITSLWCSASVTPTVGTRPYGVGTVMPNRVRNQPAAFQIPSATIVWTANVACTGHILHTRESRIIMDILAGLYIYIYIIATWPISLAVLSKAYVCGRSIATIAGSNPAEGVSVLLSCLLCAVKVAASATSWVLVRRSPIGRVRLIVCDL